MTDYTPKTFTFTRATTKGSYRTVDLAEHETVDKSLPDFDSKSKAVEFLLKRGWSVADIGRKIRYDDGRELRPQHINQIRQKMRARQD